MTNMELLNYLRGGNFHLFLSIPDIECGRHCTRIAPHNDHDRPQSVHLIFCVILRTPHLVKVRFRM